MRQSSGRAVRFVLLLMLYLLSVPVLAQDELTETFTFESGATFQFPEAWKLDPKSDPLTLASEQTEMVILDYAGLQAIGVDINEASHDAILEMYFNEYHDDRAFKAIKIEPFEIDGRNGVQYDYSADDGRARVMVIPFSNGSAGLVEEISLAGKLREEETALAIIQSFDNTEEISGTTATVAQKLVNCTVSTSFDDRVQVRVGPGENRTSIVFLSAGPSFKVQGQAEASDGSLWWKLDKEQVAPDKAVNEVWVKQDDVTSKGNCEDVLDVNAPPLVPIVNSAPPTNNNSGGSTSGQGTAPQGGAWVIIYSSGKASCFGTDTVDIAVDLPPQSIGVSVSGNSINLDGDILTRIGGNTYQGIGQITENGQVYSANITVQVVSATQIVGTLAYTGNFGDTSCSVTYPFSVNKS